MGPLSFASPLQVLPCDLECAGQLVSWSTGPLINLFGRLVNWSTGKFVIWSINWSTCQVVIRSTTHARTGQLVGQLLNCALVPTMCALANWSIGHLRTCAHHMRTGQLVNWPICVNWLGQLLNYTLVPAMHNALTNWSTG